MRHPSPITRRGMLGTLAGAALAGCLPNPAARDPKHPPSAAGELILCGGDEVFILALGGQGDDGRAALSRAPSSRKVWSWRAEDCPDIPEALRPRFRTTDDCKPVDGGRSILISSSGGAVALVDRPSRRARFWAPVINAHSIERLPNGWIAAAASTGASPLANRIILFDPVGMRELASDALHSAHGLVWDAKRELLWALGKGQLRAYAVAGIGTVGRAGLPTTLPVSSPPTLKVVFEVELPDPDGHDLAPLFPTNRLFISTGRHCWTFDLETRRFAPHETLADAASVKSYSVHRQSGQACYVQAEGENWWAQRVHFNGPDGELHLPGQRLYKARWV